MDSTADPPTSDTMDLEAALADLEDMVVIDPAGAAGRAAELLPVVDGGTEMAPRLRLRRLLAMSSAHTNDFERALEVCAEAEGLDGAEAAPIELARVRLASMQPLAIIGQIDRAIVAGEATLALLEAHGRPDLVGRAALNLGSIHAMVGHAETALPWFDQARQHLADQPLLLGQIESNRGTALAALDRFEESQAAFERAVDLLDAEEHSWAIAIAEGNLADLAARQGDLNRALRYFELSRRRLEQDEDWGDLGRINAEEASLLSVMGMMHLASERFAATIAMLVEHGAPTDLATARIAFAQTLAELDQFEEADRHLAAAAAVIDADQHQDVYLRMVALRAQLALARGDVHEAECQIAAGLAATANLPVQQLRWTILQAAADRHRGEIRLARQRLETIRDAATGLSPLLADVEGELADLARIDGDSAVGAEHARCAVEAIEGVRGTIHGDRLRQAWHHGRLGVYGSLYLSLLAEPDHASQQEAFAIAERIRNRALLDITGTGLPIANESGSPSEVTLVADIDRHRRWLNWMYAALADGQELDAERLAELAERERVVRMLEDRLAVLRPGPGLQRPLSLADVRNRLLDDRTALVSYLAIEDRLTVQVMTVSKAWGIVDLAPIATIRQLVGDLQFQIGRALAHGKVAASSARLGRLQRDIDAVLESLHEAVLAPLQNRLAGIERLIIAPSGDLHGVPFAALRGNGAYLLERYVLMMAPGISVVATMPPSAMEPGHGPARPVVVGVPDAGAPDLGTEARLVAERFPQAVTLVEAAASRHAVLTALPTADLAHLATHGRFDAAYPAASGLRLTDGWLTLDDLSRVRLDRSLLVLTGCETGRVQVQDGDDLEGLLAALIAAGASGLIASLWKTHDTATTALIDAFYDELVHAPDAATAMRHAQQQVRTVFPHPAFWAPFVAIHGKQEGT